MTSKTRNSTKLRLPPASRSADDARTLDEMAQDPEQQRDLFRALLESVDVQVAFLDPQFRFVWVNAAYAQGAGHSRDDLIGRNHFAVFPHPENEAIFTQVRDTGQPVTFHARPFEYPDQLERGITYWDWSLKPVQDEVGTLQGLVLSLVDVTGEVAADLKRQGAEEELRRRGQEFRALAEHAPDVIARFDAELRHAYVNPAVERITGLEPQALIGKTNRQLGMPEDLCALWEKETRAVFDTGQEGTLSFKLQTPTGPREFESRLAPEFARDGSVEFVLAITRDVTEHVQSQAQLEAERARLGAIIDNAPEAIVVADRACRIVLANPAAERLYARPIPYGQAFESHAGLELCHPDGTPYDPQDLPLTRSAQHGERFENLEMAIRWPDGQLRDLLVSCAPILGSMGAPRGAVGVFQDITEQKRLRRALSRYAQRLRVLREMDQAILAAQSAEEIAEAVLPHAHTLLHCVLAVVALFDQETGEATLLAVQARGETRLRQGEQVPLEGTWPLEALVAGRIQMVEDVRSESPGAIWQVESESSGALAVAHVPLVAGDRLLGAVTLGMETLPAPGTDELDIAREIADQLAIGIQQAQLQAQVQQHTAALEQIVARRTAALRASTARFQTIFEDAAMGIALVDQSGRIVASNPALEEMLGYTGEELHAMTFRDITHPEDVKAGDELFEKLQTGDQNHYQLEKRYVRQDGTIIWVQPTVSLIGKRPNQARYAIKMVQDITARKEAEEALIQAERVTIAGKLGASLAHEINNPLQSVIGCLGLAEEALAEGESPGEYLRVARAELRRAARIVTQLRDLHRQDQTREREPTDLNTLLEEVLLLSRKECETRDVEVAWERDPQLRHARVVPDRMRQVFLNLVLNAVDAMPMGGHLSIRTAETEDTPGIQVTFADSGIGIAPEGLRRIFEPFYSTKSEGLGLGLYITRQIVDQHQGRIEVKSQPGQGTTFTVWLPA